MSNRRPPVLAAGALLATVVLAGCGYLNPGVPAGSTALSSTSRAPASAGPGTTAAPAPGSGNVPSSAPSSASASAFCTSVRHNSATLATFPTTAPAATELLPLWRTVTALAPSAIRGTVSEIASAVRLVAAGQVADVNPQLIAQDLGQVGSWVTASCTA
jgi:hypothetical protein